MKTGNPKVARALIGVVLIAIVYDGVSYVRNQRRPAPLAAPDVKTATKVVAPEPSLPTRVTNNPFFHPALLSKPSSPVSSTLAPLPGPRQTVRSFEPMGAIPALWTGKDSPKGPIGLVAEPTKSALTSKTHTFRLGATVGSASPVALISIDGGPSKSYRSGDSLIEGMRLVNTSDGFVSIAASGTTFKLHVGETLQK